MNIEQANAVRWAIGKGPVIGLGMALVLLVAVNAVSLMNMRHLLGGNRQVIHTHEVLRQIDDLFSTLREAETGQRGYLLTGEEKYLEPYENSLAGLERELGELRELTANSPSQRRRFQALEPLVARE